MNCRSRIFVMAATTLICAGNLANAGPCTSGIKQVEAQIRQPGNVEIAPSAPQSVGAQLHHQPTPGSVQSAEKHANTAAVSALDRAKKADADGDAAACQKALEEARHLYGID
jgi:hypothetical protein